jgi:hypothetical protein
VFATLICEAAAPFVERNTSFTVPLEPNGDFRIDDAVSPVPTECPSPVLLIHERLQSAAGSWDDSIVFGLLADAVLVTHFAFVLFVGFGGLLVLKWEKIAWLHLPAVCWGVAIEFAGWICPLTPVENSLRQRAGETAYEGDFIARHLMWLVYPEGLTRRTQILVGVAALLVNAAIYLPVLQRLRHRRQCSPLRPE